MLADVGVVLVLDVLVLVVDEGWLVVDVNVVAVDVGVVLEGGAVVDGLVVVGSVVVGLVDGGATVVVGNSDSGNDVVGQGFVDPLTAVVVVLELTGAIRLHSVVSVVVAFEAAVELGTVVVGLAELVGFSASGWSSSG